MKKQTLEIDSRTKDIYEVVRNVLVGALGVDRDEITPGATLGSSLGAESVDYLDIVFRLERAFAIKIPRGELFPELGREFYDDVGIINMEGITYLRSNYLHLSVGADESSLTLYKLAERTNVNSLVRYVETKLKENER